MKKRRLAFWVIVAVLASACGQHPDVAARFNDAEKLMMEKPDSARYIIEQMDTAAFHSLRTKARYSLLHSISIDRCGIDTSDYALIKPADVFYLRHGSREDRAKMHFYKGRIYYNNHDYDSAIKDFLVALAISDKLDNNWLKGMICSWIAMVYNINHNGEEELKYDLLSYEYFVKDGRDLYIDNAKYLMALSYHNNGSLEKSDSIYATIPADSRFYPSAALGLASNVVFKENFDAARAVGLFKKAEESGVVFYPDIYYQYAYALLCNGQRKQCDSLLNRLSGIPGDVKTTWWKYLIAKKRGDTRRALDLLEQYRKESREFVRMQQSQSAYKSVSDYYSTLSKRSEEKATMVTLLSVIAFLVLLALVLTFIILKQRQLLLVKEERDELEKNNREMTRALEELNASKEDDSANKEQTEAKWKSYIKMYRQRYAALGKLYGKDLRKSVLPEQLETYVTDLFHELSDREARYGDFEQRLNKDLDNIMLKYRTDFPQETKEHYRFVSLIFAGFKDPAIAAILGENTSGISSKKTRLKKRVLEKETPNKDFYSVFFD